MDEERPSVTAEIAALFRALHQRRVASPRFWMTQLVPASSMRKVPLTSRLSNVWAFLWFSYRSSRQPS
jgi:hypothetical protein